ncbi:hypothetical protein Cfor_06697 [Coptotermes formosanus]|uniref:Uncharacterized protein n=1 Tax=Coptotermes formosanus TaxID=36987 RepID=A0A6L2Q9L5_COPFO|nr:hypothetical protein Cfor_06697 [Coptotermes formosanus]
MPQLIASAYSTVRRTGSVTALDRTNIDSRDEETRDTSSKTAQSYLHDSNESLRSHLNYNYLLRKKTEMVSNTRDNHDDSRKGSVDSIHSVIYLPYNHKLTPSDLQYYQHPVYVAEERPTELNNQKSETLPNETKHFITKEPVRPHHDDTAMESNQTTNPPTPISQKDDPYNLHTFTTNPYKFDAALDESIFKLFKHDRRQEYSESQDSKASKNSSQNATPKRSYIPSDDLYKNSAYYVPPSKDSDLALNLSQHSQTNDPYDGPDSYNPPAIINSYGTSFEQPGDKFPPLDLYETLEDPFRNKSHTYPMDIYKSQSPVSSYQSLFFPATYKPPPIIQNYKLPLPEGTYKSPSLADNYKPVESYRPPSPEDSYGPPSLMEILKSPQPVVSDQPTSKETYKPLSPEDSYGLPSLMDNYKPPSPIETHKLPSPVGSYGPPSLMDTYKPPFPMQTQKLPSPEISYGPPSLTDTYKPPSPMENHELPPPEGSYGPPSLMDTYKPPSPMESHKRPSPEGSYGPPSLMDTYKPPSPMESDKRPSPEGSYGPPSLTNIYKPPSPMDTYQPPSSMKIYNFSLPANIYKSPSSVDDHKPSLPMDTDKRPLLMETYKHLPNMNIYKLPSSMDISNLSPPPPPPMETYKPQPPGDEYKPPLHDNTYKPLLLHNPQSNASSNMSQLYSDDRPLTVIHKFPSFQGPLTPHISSDITMKDAYKVPLSEDQPKYNSSSEDGLADDGYPEYDTHVHDIQDYDMYDNTEDHNSHGDTHGPDHDHAYHHDPNEYYSHHHSYDHEDHEIPAAEPPSKYQYHHPPSHEYEVAVPHDHYRDNNIYHRDPKEHYSYHHFYDYDDHELPTVQRPTKYNYRYPSSYVYSGKPPPLPEELSPPKDMVGDLTSPSNGMVGSSTPPASDMAGPPTSPTPDMTQGPPPPPKDMVGIPPPPPNDMYGAPQFPPLDTHVNHLYPVVGMYGDHPPIYAYGTPTYPSQNMTEAPQTSTMPMEKKPPTTYYYLGRKLWLVPVYATGIFLVQLLLLLLKAISRHKFLAPYNFYTSLQNRNLKSRRQQELDGSTEHVAEALERAEYRYM